MLILILGTGYVAQSFGRHLSKQDRRYVMLSRSQTDYTRFSNLRSVLADLRPDLLINAAGFIGKPNVDQCELHKHDSLMANTVFVETVANACEATGTAWAQICSGCVYQGFKDPVAKTGWTEDDPPNFSFDSGPCSWYSGCKAASEEIVKRAGAYGWRLRIPFNQIDHPRNYLTKLQHYPKLLDVANSLSHLDEFASVCIALWNLRTDPGIYNITNPGWITTREVVEIIRQALGRGSADYFQNEQEMYSEGYATVKRSSCVLDTCKVAAAGIKMRPVAEAIQYSLTNWANEDRLAYP